MANLVFDAAKLEGSPTHLVFGESSSAPVPVLVTAEFFARLPAPTLSAGVFYDNRVTPWRDSRVLAVHGVASLGVGQISDPWALSTAKRNVVAIPTRGARSESGDVSAAHRTSLTKTAQRVVVNEIATQGGAETSVQNQAAQGVTRVIVSHSERARHIAAAFFGLNQSGVPVVELLHLAHSLANRVTHWHTGLSGASLWQSGAQFRSMPWGLGGVPLAGVSRWPPTKPQPPVPQPITWGSDLLFECPPLAAPALVFGGTSPCDPGTQPEPGTIIVPIRRVYMVVNEATLRRVDGNVALPAISMTLSIDADSWTWGFSASLPGSALANLEPSATGVPVEVEALINGVPYRALIDGIGRDRSFGRNDLRITGRGRTALLDSPYAPSRVFTNTTARTAQQIMGDVLSVNGVSLGWSVNWGLEDWLVPAGVFNHQGSYISALNTIAAAAGGYVQPHASAMSLSVLPRYKTAPWYWHTVTPDLELPADVTTRESIEWVERARYNRVYVSGVSQGVLGQVRRSGSAGDVLAPMVTDSLITTAGAARQRGLAVLGNTGRQANVSLRLPVLPETGVVTPGKFVRYVDGGETRLGVVRSVGVDVSMPEIWQTIGVETHVS